MKKIVHVFSYSSVIPTDQRITIYKISEYSDVPIEMIVKMAKDEEQPEGIIYQYKTGSIKSTEFYNNINEAITSEDGLPLSKEYFKEAWCSMCQPNQDELKKLADLQAKHDFEIHVLGCTNELQHEVIQEKIKSFETPVPQISYTLSFIEQTLNMEELKEKVKNKFLADKYSIKWHHEEQNKATDILLNILGEDSDTLEYAA